MGNNVVAVLAFHHIDTSLKFTFFMILKTCLFSVEYYNQTMSSQQLLCRTQGSCIPFKNKIERYMLIHVFYCYWNDERTFDFQGQICVENKFLKCEYW